MIRRLSASLFFVLLIPLLLPAQQSFDVKAHYTKHEVMIPMRDGVRLFTAIYVPNDRSTPHPILLKRTPYSCEPYGEDAYPEFVGTQRARYFKNGYIMVFQDVRGKFMSEGTWVDMRPYEPRKKSKKDIDETTDTYDTVDWLVKNVEGNNGNVGISGISYPGFFTWMGTIDAHPAVKATSPQAPVSKWMAGDDFYHNGAFLLPHAFDFAGWFGWPRPKPTTQGGTFPRHDTPDEYQYFLDLGPLSNANKLFFHDSVAFWNDLLANDHWNEHWARRDVIQYLKNIRPATLVVGGWFDTENLYGALHSYAGNEKNSPGAKNMLVMGPWYHGQWENENGDSLGAIHWGASTSVWYTEHVEGPFFDFYLKGVGAPPSGEAYVFDTGRKEWKTYSSWPPPKTEPETVWLTDGFHVAFNANTLSRGGFDEYVNDPAKPVPYTGQITHWYQPAFLLEDQRFASRRPDVLTYTSDVLQSDITLAGPIEVDLWVSTSGTDADWVVKVIDVFPGTDGVQLSPFSYSTDFSPRLGGYQMLVRADVIRGKFRDGLDQPVAFEPGTPTRVRFTLNDAYHTLRKGHKLMIQVQSSWFPMIDRNPGTFMHIPDATASDFVKTTQRVFRSPDHPSTLTLTVLPQ